ncbi:hypothetical protein Tco_1197899 [Tanacetum coccineum]
MLRKRQINHTQSCMLLFVFSLNLSEDVQLNLSEDVQLNLSEDVQSLAMHDSNPWCVVDDADWDNISIAKTKLHGILTKPSLNEIPLLVLGNNINKSQALRALGTVTPLGPALTLWPALRYRRREMDNGVDGRVDTPTPR